MSTYAPTVIIGESRIAGAWNGGQLVALAGLAIDWGTDSLLDALPPATLNLSLIDPAGQWATNADLIGLPIRLERPADPDSNQAVAGVVTMYRGRVTDASVRPVSIEHPTTGRPVRVWRVDLTAADRLADLAKVKPTPPAAPTTWQDEGERYWYPADTINQRIAAISRAVDAAGLKPFTLNDITLPAPLPLREQTAMWRESDDLSALEMMQRLYATLGLGRCAYDPHGDRTVPVTCGILSAGWALQMVAGKVQLVPADSRLYRTPAALFGMTDDRALQANDAVAVDVIELGYFGRVRISEPGGPVVNGQTSWADVDHHRDVPWTLRTPHALTGKGERRLSVELGVAMNWTTGTTTTEDYSNIAAVANEYYYRLTDLTDKWYLPNVRFDFARSTPPSSWITDTLLLPRPRDTVLFGLTGSIYATLGRISPAYQMIGGTITWTAEGRDAPRWVVEARPAPVAAGGVGSLSLGQIAAASSTATLGDVEDTLTIADLRFLTKGLT